MVADQVHEASTLNRSRAATRYLVRAAKRAQSRERGSGIDDVVRELPKFTDQLYNTERLNSAFGYISPQEFEVKSCKSFPMCNTALRQNFPIRGTTGDPCVAFPVRYGRALLTPSKIEAPSHNMASRC